MRRKLYKVLSDNAATFFYIESAYQHLIQSNPEHCGTKESIINLCEQNIEVLYV